MTMTTARVEIDATCAAEVFTCQTDPDVRWNGWATPHFDRENAERVIAMVTQKVTDPNDHFRFTWEGDTLVMAEIDIEGEAHVQRFEGPLYPIGAWYWTWSLVDDGVPTDPVALDAYLADREARTALYCRVSNAALHAALDLGIANQDARQIAQAAADAALASQ